MAVIRAFIAIETPKPIQDKLEGVIGELKKLTMSNAIRWIAAKNIHITLKFLGEVSSVNINLLAKMLQNEIINYPRFTITVGGFGAFPTLLRPRVIWVGITAPPQLLSLQNGVETETIRLGYSGEGRDFSPHLTLARISHNASPDEVHRTGQVLSRFQVGQLGSYPVDSVILFQSDLLPGGAVYTPLITIPLNSKIQNVTQSK